MKAVDDASPLVHYTTYGKTYEGRDMPMAVVGTGLKDASPASVLATNRLRVHIQGNIHAGEVEGKEAAQVLLRELALGQHADWLRSMVFLITPIFNADGNEKFALDEPAAQNGPINGMGTRAAGPEPQHQSRLHEARHARGPRVREALERLRPAGRLRPPHVRRVHPRLLPDLLAGAQPGDEPRRHEHDEGRVVPVRHEGDEGQARLGHVTTTATPGAARARRRRRRGAGAPAPARRGAVRLAAVRRAAALLARGAAGGGRGCRGWQAAVAAWRRYATALCTAGNTDTDRRAYGSRRRAGAEATRAWNSFEALPRYHNTYVGLRNRFALLSEAYAYATFEDRIKATNYFMEESLNFAMQNVDKLKKIAADADREVHRRQGAGDAVGDQDR